VFFSSFIIKIPKSSKRQSIEKREREREREKSIQKRGRKKKSSKTLQIKRESQYFERIKTFQLENLFT
jgi:hypothetical protein